MALSQLARLALKSVSESQPAERIEAFRLVAAALHEDCPQIADLATKAAGSFQAANDQQLELINFLES